MRDEAVKLNGQVIGVIQGRGFIMKRSGSRHMLKYPRPAWALSEAVFYGDVLPACDEVVVRDEERGLAYRVSTKVFERRLFLVRRGGFEPQVALGLEYWEKDTPRSREPARQLDFLRGGDPCSIS